MSRETAAMPPRPTRRPPLARAGGPSRLTQRRSGEQRAHLPAGPGGRLDRLYPHQEVVFTVLSFDAPLDLLEVARAAGVESPTACHALCQLARRGLAEEIPGRPTTWRRRG